MAKKMLLIGDFLQQCMAKEMFLTSNIFNSAWLRSGDAFNWQVFFAVYG
jgi:hypothetical protein